MRASAVMNSKLRVVIQLLDANAQLPSKANPTDAGFDLRASSETVIPVGKTGMVNLGWSMQLDEGWQAQIRGRSGLASRGIIAHSGTIDHLYRREVKVILHNFSDRELRIAIGDRIAQLVFAPVYQVDLDEGEVELTARGGFGSTGIK